MKNTPMKYLLTGALAVTLAAGSLAAPVSAAAAEKSAFSVSSENEVLDPVTSDAVLSESYVNNQEEESETDLSAGASMQSGVNANVGTSVRIYRVSSYSSIVSALRKMTLSRKKYGYMLWTKSLSSLRKKINNKTMKRMLFVGLRNLDAKSTTNDADYLMNAIHTISCNAYRYHGHYLLIWKFSYWETGKQTKKVNSEVNRIVKALNLHKGTTLREKIYNLGALYQLTCYWVNYDNTLKSHSAYAGLVKSNHTTVCQGYAALMYKFYKKVGIPVHIIYGTGTDGTTRAAHAWNVVKLGRKWYNIDATWDDTQINDVSQCCYFQFFLRGSTFFDPMHITYRQFRGDYRISSNDLNWQKYLQ